MKAYSLQMVAETDCLFRITSYNVCYTKLLRTSAKRTFELLYSSRKYRVFTGMVILVQSFCVFRLSSVRVVHAKGLPNCIVIFWLFALLFVRLYNQISEILHRPFKSIITLAGNTQFAPPGIQYVIGFFCPELKTQSCSSTKRLALPNVFSLVRNNFV